MNYESIIGLEVHVELKTETKLFCSCKNEFGAEPNTNICPVCTGQPGALPCTNKKAVLLVLRAAAMLGCDINRKSGQCRKHYFYPDLPKGYQISQRETPVGINGSFEFVFGDDVRKIRIHQVHLEEDAGKLVHFENGTTGVDYNRAGVPLIEIVTEPDLKSADEVHAFLEALRRALIRAGVSDCRMEQGALRCDVNVSLKVPGKECGERVEMKNVNSFSAAEHAVMYEIKRQSEMLLHGEKISRETRRWDDEGRMSHLMRGKESTPDYKFMPDPDIPVYIIPEDEVQKAFSSLPENEVSRRVRYEALGVSKNDVEIIISDDEMSRFVDLCEGNVAECAKLLVGEVSSILSKEERTLSETKLTPKELSLLSGLLSEGKINRRSAKPILEKLMSDGGSALKYAEEYVMISDESMLSDTVAVVISENPAAVEDYKKGKDEVRVFLVGQCMKKLRGRADTVKLNEILNKNLKEI